MNRRLKRAHSLYWSHCLHTCSLSDLDSNTFNLLGWLGVYAIQVMLLGNGYIIWLISSLPLTEF